MLTTNRIVILVVFLGVAISWFVFQSSSDQEMVLLDEASSPITPANLKEDAKIAIIGSGIGGSSAAYFARKHLGPRAEIHVYEKSNKVGGRLRTIEFNGNQFEAGGSLIHSSNKYMVRFINELGLERRVRSSGKFGLYNGERLVLTESDNSYITKMKMLWRYGFFSLMHLSESLGNMLKTFVNIYRIQDEEKAFKFVPEMLRTMGGESFYNYSQNTAEDVMYANGIGKLLIEELVTAVTRSNYGQDSGVNAFTGYVSMAGAQGGSLFAVKGGNSKVPQKLLEISNTTVFLNRHINSIRREKQNGSIVYFLDNNISEKSQASKTVLTLDDVDMHAYDAVIVAVPLEVPESYIDCLNCFNWPTKSHLGTYQQTVATFVQADINLKFFRFDEKDSPLTEILTTESPSNRFSSIGKQSTVEGDKVNPSVYKVFSRTPLKDDFINELFLANSTSIDKKVVPWLAYPHYTPPEQFSSFVLDDGVFYVNAIERAASAMEMSAIGGRNAALLTKKYFEDTDRTVQLRA